MMQFGGIDPGQFATVGDLDALTRLAKILIAWADPETLQATVARLRTAKEAADRAVAEATAAEAKLAAAKVALDEQREAVNRTAIEQSQKANELRVRELAIAEREERFAALRGQALRVIDGSAAA